MMFKVLSMHSKPCEHAKYNEILRSALKKDTMFSKVLTDFIFHPESFLLQVSYFACTCFSMMSTPKVITNHLITFKVMFLMICINYDFLDQN